MTLLHHKNLFGMICYCPSKIGVIPLKWQEENHRLVFRGNENSGLTPKRKLHIQYLIYSFIPLQGIYCFYFCQDSYNLSFSDKMMYGLGLFGLITAITIQFSCVFKASSQCQYINGIVEISKSINRSFKPKSTIKKLDFVFAACLTPSIIIAPFLLVFGLHWFSPCKPSLAGYIFIPECSSAYKDFETTMLNFVVKALIFGINHWSWAASLFCVAFCTSGFLVLGVLSFVDFLHAFEEMAKDETEEGIYQIRICYRKIQILECLCNDVQQSDLMVVTIMGGTLVLISAIDAALMVPWTLENAPGLLYFVLVAVNLSLYLLVGVGTMSEIFQEFEDLLNRLKRRRIMIGQHRKRLCFQWRERFYLSCTPVKFKFGEFNFVDRLTPLKCISFAINQSVSILLLSK